MSITPRAKLLSFRLFISPSHLTHGCACFVPEPGQNIHLPLPKKKEGSSKLLDFFVNVVFWLALSLTLNQRVQSSTLGSPSKNVFDSWGEINFGPNGFAYFATTL